MRRPIRLAVKATCWISICRRKQHGRRRWCSGRPAPADWLTTADWAVAALVPHGYAVVGVSVRSSAQARFPAQLHDIKSAIRFIRQNAQSYELDSSRIAVMGTSSGGWVASMAATTQGNAALEGEVGVGGNSGLIRAAVAFWPPTNFLAMDAWAIKPCDQLSFRGRKGFCHDGAQSPESRLVGCPIQSCPDATQAANPIRYVSRDSAPILIIHGQSDPLVPHHQGEALYQAYNKACADATFVSVPMLGHGPLTGLTGGSEVAGGATIRSTSQEGCVVQDPVPHSVDAATVVDFLAAHLR